MIPSNLNTGNDLIDATSATEAELTFFINKDDIVSGKVDGIEAIKQTIAVILNVERYRHYIYSWNFGTEFDDLIGQDTAYVCPEITRRITEALTQDDRITGISEWKFEKNKTSISASFTVHTIYGDVEATKEVNI